MNMPLRLKIAQCLSAVLPRMTASFKRSGVIGNNPEEERLAEQFLREAATAVLFVADQDEKRLKSDCASGEYQEAVQKIVDGVVEDIKQGHIKDKRLAQAATTNAQVMSEFVTNPELHMQVLKYGTHPSSYHHRRRTFSPLQPVPWAEMAQWCMWDDCHQELERRPDYQALPSEVA